MGSSRNHLSTILPTIPLYDFPSLLQNMRTMLYDRTQGSRLSYTTWTGAYSSSPIEPLLSSIVTVGMPQLKGHNPKSAWENENITFDSKRYITWCLDKSATIYAVPENQAREENLTTRLSEIQAEDLRLPVKKLTLEARIPTKGSSQAAGNDLYAQETQSIPATGQGIIGTGIAIGLPLGTYGRIGPRSGLAAKHSLTVNAAVIEADNTGELKVVLINLGTKDYKFHKGDKIAQLIVERIRNDEAVLVSDFEATIRGTKEFGSSNKGVSKQVGVWPDCLIISLKGNRTIKHQKQPQLTSKRRLKARLTKRQEKATRRCQEHNR